MPLIKYEYMSKMFRLKLVLHALIEESVKRDWELFEKNIMKYDGSRRKYFTLLHKQNLPVS